MNKSLTLNERLAPAEKIFFTWLIRVFAAATLVGSACIDDAPLLDVAAMIIAVYVAIRVTSQFSALAEAVPFENRLLKTVIAVFAVVLLGLSFIVVAIFVERVALFIIE